jgi:CRP/FNR family transcriptional regulator, cyclic AMP receptor protein
MPAAIDPQLFARVELFDNLTSSDLLALLAASGELTVAAGQTIYEAGQVERALYVLLSGSVEVDVTPPRAADRMVAELGPGSVFGESSFFHSGPHSATVKALSDSRLVRINREAFDALLQSNNLAALRVAANAAKILAARLRQADEFIVELLESIQDRKVHAALAKFRSTLDHSVGASGSSMGPMAMN